MIAIWKFLFHDLGPGSPPGDLQYSNVAGITGYIRKILDFSGINIHCDLTSGSAIPNISTSFKIEDVEKTLDVTDFIDEYVTITVISDESPVLLNRSWKLKIVSAVYSYGTIKIQCESELGAFKNSNFPPYPSVKSLAPEVDEVPGNLCVPYTIGKVFIPIYPVLKSGLRKYLLGKTSDVTGDFTITKVRSPRTYPTLSYWDDSFTYNQSDTQLSYTAANYKVTDMIIARSDPAGEVDSNGIFQLSGKILSPLVEYEGDSTSKHPGGFILDVLEKAAVDNCDSASFTTVDNDKFVHVNWAGGFWQYENTETLVGGMLSQCDCYFTFDDKINFNIFDDSSVETFSKAKIIENSFTISAISKSAFDGGVVRWRWFGEPEDVLTAEHAVKLESNVDSSHIPTNPDTDALEYRYGIDYYSDNALKFGILHFQKKHGKVAQISFSTTLDKISTRNTINPGQVVDIDDNASSGNVFEAYDELTILIYELNIHPDLQVDINGYSYDLLESFQTVQTYIVSREGSTAEDIVIENSENTGDSDTLTCVLGEIANIYGVTTNNSGFNTIKNNSKAAASGLWNSLGDSAKWEPWDGAAVTTNHTWTGDTTDFAITSESLTATFTASESAIISLSGLSIHAEDLRVKSTITITGSSASTYCRIKLTDEDSTVRYFYLANGDPSWVDDADEYLVGSGTIAETLSDYGLSEIITDISIECAVHSGDTSLEISIDYIDFEYYHDLFEDCAMCSGESPAKDVGAYVVLTSAKAYAFIFDACDGGDFPNGDCGCYYNITSYVTESDEVSYEDTETGCDTLAADYELMPWETVLLDVSAHEWEWYTFLLPQESDYTLNVGDMVRVVDVSHTADVTPIWVAFLDSPCEGKVWEYAGPMDTVSGKLEFIWTGSTYGWHQLQYPRVNVSGCEWVNIFDNTYWLATGTGFSWDGSEWDSTSTTCYIYCDPELNTWYNSYRPNKVRVTFSGGADGGTLLLEIVDDNDDTIASQSSPTSPQEMDITFGDYNIEKLKFTNFSGSITNIEFFN